MSWSGSLPRSLVNVIYHLISRVLSSIWICTFVSSLHSSWILMNMYEFLEWYILVLYLPVDCLYISRWWLKKYNWNWWKSSQPCLIGWACFLYLLVQFDQVGGRKNSNFFCLSKKKNSKKISASSPSCRLMDLSVSWSQCLGTTRF